jgi:hypothetical protein
LNPGAVVLRVAVAALAAAAGAYAGNRLFRGLLGQRAVILIAPGLEEALKTGLALLLGAPVLVAHVSFGLLEALYDLTTGRDRRGSRRAAAALSGLGGHTLFGALTVAVAGTLTGAVSVIPQPDWLAGSAVAYLAHVGWNALVMGRVKTNR